MNKNKIFLFTAVLIALSLPLNGCGLFGIMSADESSNFNNGQSGEIDRITNHQENHSNGGSAPVNYPEFLNDAAEEPSPQTYPGQATENRSSSAEVEAEGAAFEPPIYITAVPPSGQDDPYDDMFFEDYGVNPFIDTEDDHLSTFATDVDTGAYTLARSYLLDGYRPPEDAVRVEEFINYFYQGYDPPSARDTFAIYIDGAPTPFTENDRYQVIRIGVQGYTIPESDRKDAVLTFVIDVSGSMSNGNRLEMVQDALALLVEELRPSDSVAIVAYTDTAWVVLEPTSAAENELIIESIYSLYPMASTNAEAGLVQGYRLADTAFDSNAVNRVILCSDGVANVGNTGPGSIWESIEEYAAQGITLTAVGVGMGNYNDVLMEQLADNGDGFYAYIDSYEEARRLFKHKLVSTLQVIAMDAKIQVEFNPDVVSRYRLVGFENRAVADEDFRDNTVDAAEIGAGHSVTALYEIKLHQGTSGEIATVHLRWEDPDTERVHELSETFSTREMEDAFYLADPYFQMDVIVAEFAEILRDSYWAQDSSFDMVYAYAREVSDRLELVEFYEFIELVEIANHLALR